MEGQKSTSFCPDQNMASDFGTTQSHAIKGSSVLVGVSWVLCHMDSSTATMDMMMVGGSGFIDCYCELNVGPIYPVLICLLDVK